MHQKKLQEANWNDIPAEEASLDPMIYTDSMSYDALERIRQRTDIDQNITTPTYNLTGLLQSLNVRTHDDQQTKTYVSTITYDAKGQRQQITYGNQTTTSYTYDPKTYAVTNILTTNQISTIQNLNYTYDPVGNIILKQDTSQEVVYYNNQEVLPAGIYTYDSLYQLIKAEGRQQIGNSNQIEVKNKTS